MNNFEKAKRERLIKQSFEYIEKMEAILSKIDGALQKKAA